jgi:hypothetical protein
LQQLVELAADEVHDDMQSITSLATLSILGILSQIDRKNRTILDWTPTGF